MNAHETITVVGAAETARIGAVPNRSALGLHAEAALGAVTDAGLRLDDVDGIACAGQSPLAVAWYLGIEPAWVDGTSLGGCSFMIHLRHAVAALQAGHCNVALITHGESGRSGVGVGRPAPATRSELGGQFEAPFGLAGPTTQATIPALRYMRRYSVTAEELATVPVIQREWAALNSRATFREPITVADVLSSRLIAYPFHLLECCATGDGGGAMVLVRADRAADLPRRPVYILGTGEAVESALISQMDDFTSSRAYRNAAASAFREARLGHSDIDHLMIYDAFAHHPFYGLEDLGFCGRGEAPRFIAARHTAPGGTLPLNTNGGGLSYVHTGMYGMFAMQESVRQLRGEAEAQVPGVTTSMAHGGGLFFGASGSVIFSNQLP